MKAIVFVLAVVALAVQEQENHEQPSAATHELEEGWVSEPGEDAGLNNEQTVGAQDLHDSEEENHEQPSAATHELEEGWVSEPGEDAGYCVPDEALVYSTSVSSDPLAVPQEDFFFREVLVISHHDKELERPLDRRVGFTPCRHLPVRRNVGSYGLFFQDNQPSFSHDSFLSGSGASSSSSHVGTMPTVELPTLLPLQAGPLGDGCAVAFPNPFGEKNETKEASLGEAAPPTEEPSSGQRESGPDANGRDSPEEF